MVKRGASSVISEAHSIRISKRVKLDQLGATLVIQRVWRWRHLRKVVRQYLGIGYSLRYFQWKTYASSKHALCNRTTLNAMAAAVEGLLKICPSYMLDPGEMTRMKQGAYPLLFMVAYQICMNTFEVFSIYETEEMLFSESAWRFVRAFEAMCRIVSWGASDESVPLSTKKEFVGAVFAVARDYWTWSDQRRPLKERRYRQRLTKLYFERYESSETRRMALDPAASHEWESESLRQEAMGLTDRIREFETAFVSACDPDALVRFNVDLKQWLSIGGHDIRYNDPHMENYGSQLTPDVVTTDMLVHAVLVLPDTPRFSVTDFTHPDWVRQRRVEFEEAITKAVTGIHAAPQQCPWPLLRFLWMLSHGLGRVVGRDPEVPAGIHWSSLGQYVSRCQIRQQPLGWRRILNILQDVVQCMLTIADPGNDLATRDAALFQAAIYADRGKRPGFLRAYLQFLCDAYLRVIFDRYNRVAAFSRRRIQMDGVGFERARFNMRLVAGFVNLTRLKEIVVHILRVLLAKDPSHRARLEAAEPEMLRAIAKNVVLYTVFREDAASKALLPHTLLLDETGLGGARVELIRIPGFVSLVASVKNALHGNPKSTEATAVEDEMAEWLNNCRGASFVSRERFNNAVRASMKRHGMSKVDTERAIHYNYSCFPMGKKLHYKALAHGIEQALVESLLMETAPSMENIVYDATEFLNQAAVIPLVRSTACDFPGLAVFYPRVCDIHRALLSIARINLQVHSELYAAVVRGVMADTLPAV